jgi:phosphoribosylformimino-5-aminoimidazole carboxamide ribotide isomerase
VILFPAIDLRRGSCVRLERGAADRETVYDTDPLRMGQRFADLGAEWVHVVDLDAAFGEGSNRECIRQLVQSVPISVQSGGGLRTLEDLEEVLDAGVARAVIGTAAVERPELVRTAVERWGADRIAVGLDARGRHPAVRGWRETTRVDVLELGESLAELGVRTLIYTDIDRDGMLAGPNLDAAVELAVQSGTDVLVSGGVGSMADVAAVAAAARSTVAGEGKIAGVIVGKAIYEGRVDLRDALELART